MMKCSSGFCDLNLTKSPMAEKNEVLKIEVRIKVKIYTCGRYVCSTIYRIRGPDRFCRFLFSERNKTTGSTRSIDRLGAASTWEYQRY